MNVTRVTDATGSHIEPVLDQAWSEETKLEWHASVVAHDTGLHIELHPFHRPGKAAQYGMNVGNFREGGLTSIAARPFADAWDFLVAVSIGAQALLRQQQYEEKQDT